MANKPDMTKPRKKRHELSDITNSQQRAVAEIVRPIIDFSGLTMKQFAMLNPSQSLTIINRMFNPNTNGVETPKTYCMLAIKLSKINSRITAEDYYKKLMTAAKLNYQKYPFKDNKLKVYRIKSHKGNITYTTIVCDYQPKGILVQQLITGGYIIDNIESIDKPCFIEHRENS